MKGPEKTPTLISYVFFVIGSQTKIIWEFFINKEGEEKEFNSLVLQNYFDPTYVQ